MLGDFVGKSIKIKSYIDHTYYRGGYPQRRRQCWVDDKLVYDSKDDIKEINYDDFQKLQNYGYDIGAYNRSYNGLDGYDICYQFVLKIKGDE